tara:strand:- start:423 stop:722 length:300 start_codon:yes stop_codon:yes gene_type:complete
MTDTLGPYFRGYSYKGAYETVCIARGKPEDFDDLADAPIAFTGYDKATKQEADLLCAAPDLLAALENVLEDFIAIGGKDSDRSGVIIEATSAIAKARGE